MASAGHTTYTQYSIHVYHHVLTFAPLPPQVQSAPAVEPPELKDHPNDRSVGDGITIRPRDHSDQDEGGRESSGEDVAADSPRAGVKMSFGMRKGSSATGGSMGKRTLENVLGTDEEGDSEAPRKKLASIQQIEREQRDERKALEREVARTAQKMRAEERKKITPDERKKMIQNLVSSIPTTKEELFEYVLKWDAIDQVGRREVKWYHQALGRFQLGRNSYRVGDDCELHFCVSRR